MTRLSDKRFRRWRDMPKEDLDKVNGPSEDVHEVICKTRLKWKFTLSDLSDIRFRSSDLSVDLGEVICQLYDLVRLNYLSDIRFR